MQDGFERKVIQNPKNDSSSSRTKLDMFESSKVYLSLHVFICLDSKSYNMIQSVLLSIIVFAFLPLSSLFSFCCLRLSLCPLRAPWRSHLSQTKSSPTDLVVLSPPSPAEVGHGQVGHREHPELQAAGEMPKQEGLKPRMPLAIAVPEQM